MFIIILQGKLVNKIQLFEKGSSRCRVLTFNCPPLSFLLRWGFTFDLCMGSIRNLACFLFTWLILLISPRLNFRTLSAILSLSFNKFVEQFCMAKILQLSYFLITNNSQEAIRCLTSITDSSLTQRIFTSSMERAGITNEIGEYQKLGLHLTDNKENNSTLLGEVAKR